MVALMREERQILAIESRSGACVRACLLASQGSLVSRDASPYCHHTACVLCTLHSLPQPHTLPSCPLEINWGVAVGIRATDVVISRSGKGNN
eukprot:scaffold128725_cov36-Tisochrysis_lutea.AAC.1